MLSPHSFLVKPPLLEGFGFYNPIIRSALLMSLVAGQRSSNSNALSQPYSSMIKCFVVRYASLTVEIRFLPLITIPAMSWLLLIVTLFILFSSFWRGSVVAPLCFNYSKFHGRKQGFFWTFFGFFSKKSDFSTVLWKTFFLMSGRWFLILNFGRCLFPTVVCSCQVIMVTLADSVDELRVKLHCVADSSELLACEKCRTWACE